MTAASLAAASILLGAARLAAAQDAAAIAVREGVARNIYVTVADDKGVPPSDLTPQEVEVKEDGAVRSVLAVSQPPSPCRSCCWSTTRGQASGTCGGGVAGFIRIVQRMAEIAIISTAKQNTVLVDFTSDPGALMYAVNRLTTRTTTGGYQLEAIRESALTLMRRSAPRPVIVVLALEGKEYSSLSSKPSSTTSGAAARWFTSSASASRR